MLKDGTELHLASFCLEVSGLHLACADDPALTAVKSKHADVLGGAPPCLHWTEVRSLSSKQLMCQCRDRAQ